MEIEAKRPTESGGEPSKRTKTADVEAAEESSSSEQEQQQQEEEEEQEVSQESSEDNESEVQQPEGNDPDEGEEESDESDEEMQQILEMMEAAWNPTDETGPYGFIMSDRKHFSANKLDQDETLLSVIKIKPKRYNDPQTFSDYISSANLLRDLKLSSPLGPEVWTTLWKTHPRAVGFFLLRETIKYVGIYGLAKKASSKNTRLFRTADTWPQKDFILQNRIRLDYFTEEAKNVNLIVNAFLKRGLDPIPMDVLYEYLRYKGCLRYREKKIQFVRLDTVNESFLRAVLGSIYAMLDKSSNSTVAVTKEAEFFKLQNGYWRQDSAARLLDNENYTVNPVPVYYSGEWNNREQFVSELVEKHCKASGCTYTSLFTLPYCEAHLMEIHKVTVQATTLRSSEGNPLQFRGLFAWNKDLPEGRIIFQQNDVILPYYGEKISQKERILRYGKDGPASHAVETSTGVVWDSARIRGAASNANTSFDGRNNAILVENPDETVSIVANRPIMNGQEIFVDYGPAYVMVQAETLPSLLNSAQQMPLTKDTVSVLTPRRKSTQTQEIKER